MTDTVQIEKSLENRMEKAIENFQSALGKIRTGRANPGLLDPVHVSYYGNEAPLSQVASVSVLDNRTLSVTPWEKSMVAAVEKAIINANLGLNPMSVGGQNIRVPLPPLTEERRKELIKQVKQEVEHAKIAVRNVRRDGNNQLKDLVKEKTISEDEERRSQERVQKITDKFIEEIDKILVIKEKELINF